MGWDFTIGATRKQIINQIIKDPNRTVWAHKVVRNHLWTVEGGSGIDNHIIVLYLLDKRTEVVGTGDAAYTRTDWGYKDMTESMHPYHYDCPLHFLTLAPVASERWRQKVAEFHAQKIKTAELFYAVKPGDTVRLNEKYKIGTLKVVSTRPFLGRTETGKLYRIPKKGLAEIVRT